MNDTICALATTPGGALGIIRVSGPQAIPIVSTLCTVGRETIATAPPNTLHYTRLADPYVATMSQPEIIDEVVISVFRAPRSYTGEDSVEISCHGSRYILNKLLDILVAQGCRMARPGEFTQRAYLNGKMDLSQAEAVADLIASANKATHDIAMSQMRGQFSTELKSLRDQLLKLTSLLELELDFSDHEDLEFADRSELLALACHIDSHIAHLAHTFEVGQALKQGIPVAIVGKTNVGKSTLLNALLKDDRAIVSDVHGTTRDTIEDIIDIHGITFRFIDTAGIRQTHDAIEQIGIDRTYAAISKARIVLWVIDVQPTEEEQQDMAERCRDKSLIIVRNKTDVDGNQRFSFLIPHTSFLQLSAKFDHDFSPLESAILAAADIPSISDTDVIVTTARHYEALIHARQNLKRVLEGMGAKNVSEALSSDLLAEDLRLVLSDLAEITGEGQITPQETLNNIFSHFCIGK